MISLAFGSELVSPTTAGDAFWNDRVSSSTVALETGSGPQVVFRVVVHGRTCQ